MVKQENNNIINFDEINKNFSKSVEGKELIEFEKFNKLLENYITDIEVLDFEIDENELDIDESIQLLEDIEEEK